MIYQLIFPIGEGLFVAKRALAFSKAWKAADAARWSGGVSCLRWRDRELRFKREYVGA